MSGVSAFWETLSAGFGWLYGAAGWLGLLAGGVATVGGLLYPIVANDRNYEKIRGRLRQSGPRSRYRSILEALLNRVDRRLGSFLSLRALVWCLTVACFYPFLLLIVAWGFGEQPRIAGRSLFAEQGNPLNASFLLASIVFGVMACGSIASKADTLGKWLSGVSAQRKLDHENPRPSMLPGLFRAVAGVVSGLVVGSVTALIIGGSVGTAMIVFAFIVLVAVLGGFVFAAAFTVAFAGAFVFLMSLGAVYLAFFIEDLRLLDMLTDYVDVSVVLILCVYGALPLCNAVLDWLSLAASRWLLRDLLHSRIRFDGATRLLRKAFPRCGFRVVARLLLRRQMRSDSRFRSAIGVVLHIAIDISLALGFLILLAILLPLGMATFDRLTPDVAIGWEAYLEAARADPLGEGLVVTGMLLTTLIPTVVHLLLAGVVLIFPHPVVGATVYERWLREDNPAPILRLGVLGWFLTTVLLSWLLLLALGIVIYALLSSFFGPFGQFLYELARWSGGLAG